MNEPPHYWLPQHVYTCAVDEGVVFLDLEHDKYFGLSGQQARALYGLIIGWPLEVRSESQTLAASNAVELAEALVNRGLLTHANMLGKPAAAPICEWDDAMLDASHDIDNPVGVQGRDVLNFLVSCASATWELRYQSLHKVMDKVAARKRSGTRKRRSTLDGYRAAELANIFRRLRLFAFTAQDHCLFSAVALIRFLSFYNLYPTLVVGVKTTPWRAHCWVQAGNFVLADTPEIVKFYRPIFAI